MMAWISMGLLVIGGVLMALAGLGLYRMPDLFTRMHAATKGASLGVGLMLIAAAIGFGELAVATKVVVTTGFIFLTAPVAAHLLGRAAYSNKTPLWERTVIDEGKDKIASRGEDRVSSQES
ncbi:MAG: monovalent cation/H(+) antiporter subunit G [Terrimicrobiaceae bacterium]